MAPAGENTPHNNNIVTLVKPARDNYVGEKRNHLRDGYGVYSYENKFFKYEGQWKAGKKHGHGKLLLKDGSFYEGEFREGEITGHGFKYWAISKNTYSGQFLMGELHGYGVMRYLDASVYEGQWSNNKREGRGKLTYADGSWYEGEFYNNKMHGDGKHGGSDGAVYEGGFIGGKRHGHGVLKMADGTVFDGQWSNGIFSGHGIMIHASGVVYEGLWVNGKPAQMAVRMALVDVDESAGLTMAPGENFCLTVQMIDEDGQSVPDNGREIKVSAGYKYLPETESKENSNLFEAIEDAEESIIETSLGYTVLPYPLADHPVPGLVSEGTDLTTVSKIDETEEDSQPNADKLTDDSEAKEVDTEQERKAPETKRAKAGVVEFSYLQLLPPPPLYRPFQLELERANTDMSKKGQSKSTKPSSTSKPSAESKTGKSSKASILSTDSDGIVRPGQYVLMIEDVTDPPFMGVKLPTLYTFINIISAPKAKRKSVVPKEKGPKEPNASQTKVKNGEDPIYRV